MVLLYHSVNTIASGFYSFNTIYHCAQFTYILVLILLVIMHKDNGLIDKTHDKMLLLYTALIYSEIRKEKYIHIRIERRYRIMAITESQKKYEKKRAKEYKNVSARYRISDIELIRLERYLESTGMSNNAYIQMLIKRDLDSKGIAYPDTPDMKEK